MKKPRNNKTGIKNAIAVLIIFIVSITVNDIFLNLDFIPTWREIYSSVGLSKPPNLSDAEVSVHFIDVGQGDSQLILTPEFSVLIDSGEAKYSSTVINYIHGLGVKKLDYIIPTHPHSDHIGGFSKILKEFPIGRVIMADMDEDVLPTTSSFINMLEVIESKGIETSIAVPNQSIYLGKDISLEIIAPVSHYKDLNNYSIVSRLVHGENSFLFTGDIEKTAETDILNSNGNISANVLSVPHHGSRTSSTDKFISAVNPEYTIFQLGADNTYGHPHSEVLKRYKSTSAVQLRSDLHGDIVFESDGNSISFYTTKGEFARKEAA